MKKIISLLMLVTSINCKAIAQQQTPTQADKLYNLPADFVVRSFTADLGKGNKMQIDLSDIDDLDRFKNIDSLLRIFLQDIVPLKDSLADELASKRIDYFTDELGQKKIRIRISKPDGANFLLQQGNLLALKLEQDTVVFLGSYTHKASNTILKSVTETRYYRLSFYVNQLSDLSNINGLNEKINSIRQNKNGRWKNDGDNRWRMKNGDPSIYSNHQPAGYVSGYSDYIRSLVAVNFQNYKNYFVPSASLGIGLGLNNGRIKHELNFMWEPDFFFGKTAQGNLKTYRNDFVSFSYHRSAVKKNSTAPVAFINQFSFGYLIRRSGDFYEKNTMRIGVGQVSLFKKKINLEPIFYFNNLFKGVTPGLRLTVNF